ncbi:MAG: DotU family type IV/VI secretion system protein [bacterium]|nr:DotU family type IV/VI secretion system protein [bacterium]
MAATPVRRSARPGLLDLTSSFFALILSLRRAVDLGPEPSLRQRIGALLADFEREALEHGYLRDDVDRARFALTAFLDETILDTNWSQRELWRDRPLQLDLFAERRAGQRFFDELHQLRRQGEAKRAVVEIFHQCLNLGFEGQYRLAGGDQLAALKADLDRQLGFDPRDRRELKLSPHGKRPDAAFAPQEDRFPFWPLLAIGTGALIVLYVVLTIWLNSSTQQAVGSITLNP